MYNIIMGKTTHGLSRTSEWEAWRGTRKRCYVSTNKDYKSYGGRGIKVCDSWNESFENFLNDMGKKPSKRHSLDRIDVDGDYTPENCRWATQQVQSHNRRKFPNKTSKYIGVCFNKQINRWQAQVRYNKPIYIGVFRTELEAALAYNKTAEKIYGESAKLNDLGSI